MNKKLASLVLSGLIVLNSTGCLETVYANNNNQQKELIKNEDTKTTKVVYLQNGEGDRNAGDGSADRPYQNIRTALKNIKDGETLKLVGTVLYTEYDKDSAGAALPLIIDKNITIEGDGKSGLYLRAPIELGANVTFKNIRLEMVPEVSLGRILGQVIPRSATIFVAGHELTLDNVNTRIGTSASQYNDRPYISGGAYKNKDVYKKDVNTRAKSIINIKNPNSETKFSGIYAGDYYKDRDLDVEINIDGNVVSDNKIYTGEHNHKLNGDVVVNLGAKSNITEFDKTNHNGNIDVKLNKDAYIVNFDAKDIRNLTLEENSRIILASDAKFNVNNVVLKNDATIDFRDMTNNVPTVKGNFEGETNVDSSRKGGTIFLNNNQTLDVKGALSGTTRLNNRDFEPVDRFIDNHIYVKTNLSSTGTLSIEDSMFDNYKLKPVKNSDCIEWTSERIQSGFADFRWISGEDRIINNNPYIQKLYKMEFIDDKGQTYIPDMDEMFNDFEYKLTIPGNKVVELDHDADGVDFGLYDSDDNSYEIGVGIYTQIIPEGKFTLKVTHKKTKRSISRDIYLVKDGKQLTGNVSIAGSPIEGRIISADVSNLPRDIANVKYKWYVDGNADPNQKGKDFVLKQEHVGKSIKVEVEAMNYLGKSTSTDVTVKPKNIAPVIKGIQDKEINAGDVDKFNTSDNLNGITGEDYNGNPLTVTVTGKVEKPKAGTNEVYKIKYSVTDTDGNTTEEIRNVTVTNQKPTISGLTDIVITKGENYDIENGVTAEDYEDKTITNIVYPKEDLTKLAVGLHKIKYSVTDSDGNTTEEERTVVVNNKTSLNGPKIHGANDITLKVSQVDVFNASHKLTGITVSDDIDSPSDIKLEVSGEARKPLGGTNETYELTYTAIDSDLNKTVVKRNVTVTNQKPTISGLTELNITKGETADIRVGVSAKDHEDGAIVNVVYPTTDLSKLDVGTHKITYSVTDSDGNITEEERTVVVKEKVLSNGPEIHGANDITLKISQVDEFNKNHKLTGVTVVDDIETGLVPKVSGDAGKPAPGKNEVYKLTYTVEDKDGNKTELVRNVTVTNQLPTISGLSDIAITEGDNIDLKSGVIAHDYEDGDITKDLVCLTDLKSLTVGENTVYYSVKDADGNITKANRKVVVLEKVEQQPDVPGVPEKPETPDTKPEEPEKPQQPETPNAKPEDDIIENLPQIEGIEFGQGNATIESPLSVKVDTIDGLKELLNLTEKSNFTVSSVEEVKEDGNFLIYLLKITKKSITRAEEPYFIEAKVAKDNKEVIKHLESIVDKDNTNNENNTTGENKPNNNIPNNNENSSSNNTANNSNSSSNNNNLDNSSNQANKEENPKTYDSGIGSYILSGIGSIGLLSILNNKKKRKK
nr:immunoglobulin-like domain-containing protein [uncultured Romboutsia sp.]